MSPRWPRWGLGRRLGLAAGVVLQLAVRVTSEGLVTESSCDAMSQLQLKRHETLGNQSKLRSRSRVTVLDNRLYWQGYGKESLASYFIGFLGQDLVQVGGIKATAKLGLNLMGTTPAGNFYQSVQSDAAVLGLLPGCFSGASCGPESYDDLLSSVVREGKIHRAFTLCFDDRRGGGKLFLGRPQVPADAMRIPLHPLTDGVHPYAPLAEASGAVDFFFGKQKVASRTSQEWNQLVQSGAAYTDTGTAGLLLPGGVLDEVLREVRRKIMADEMCASIWGPYLSKFTANHLNELTVTQAAATCGEKLMEDFVVRLGTGVSLNISKSTFFYETKPCSNELRISWSSSSDSESFVFGTALNYGKTLLYDTSDLEAPSLIVLGPADGCQVSWAQTAASAPQSLPGQMLGAALPVENAIELKGHPGQVLGPDGTMTANLMIGTPPQEMTVQLDTGSQKLIGIHQGCRDLGLCFLVQPEDIKSTALLPGPEYGTTKCQKQLQVLTQLLTNSTCKQVNSKLLCACSSQEECLRQILSASASLSEGSPPSGEKCGARRQEAAGCEKTEFQPEASESFTPSLRAAGRGISDVSEVRFAAQVTTKVEKHCQLYDLCTNKSAPFSSTSEASQAVVPTDPGAETPATAPEALMTPPGGTEPQKAPEDGLIAQLEGAMAGPAEPAGAAGDEGSEPAIAAPAQPAQPAAAPAAQLGSEMERVLGAAPAETLGDNEPRLMGQNDVAPSSPASSLGEKPPWQSESISAEIPGSSPSAPFRSAPELGSDTAAALPPTAAVRPAWDEAFEENSKVAYMTDNPGVLPDVARDEVVMASAPEYPSATSPVTEEAAAAPAGGSVVSAPPGATQPLVPAPIPSFPSIPVSPDEAVKNPSEESVSAANFPDNSATPPVPLDRLHGSGSGSSGPGWESSALTESQEAAGPDTPRDEVLDMVPVVPTLSPQEISLAPVSDFTDGPRPQAVIGAVQPVSQERAAGVVTQFDSPQQSEEIDG